MTSRRRAQDEDEPIYPMYLGIGSLQGASAPDDDPPEPPAIWLPEHRSGSRFGGWRRHSLAPKPRAIGFRRP